MVKETIEKIEKDLEENSDILLNNFNTFQQKYRGDKDLDVILYTEYDETFQRTYVKLYVANINDRVFNKYLVNKGNLEKIKTERKNGHKRIHYQYR